MLELNVANDAISLGRKAECNLFALKDGDRPAGQPTDANNVGNAPGRKLSRQGGRDSTRPDVALFWVVGITRHAALERGQWSHRTLAGAGTG